MHLLCKVVHYIVGELTQVLQEINMCPSFAEIIKDFFLRGRELFFTAAWGLLGKSCWLNTFYLFLKIINTVFSVFHYHTNQAKSDTIVSFVCCCFRWSNTTLICFAYQNKKRKIILKWGRTSTFVFNPGTMYARLLSYLYDWYVSTH
jgi:hypothetical protein